jgi:CheY-like chemotaxis protein
MRILLVEDDERLASPVMKSLRGHGYAVDLAKDGEDAIYRAEVNQYDLIILDVMLPLKDGFTVCRELRGKGLKTPVLMLTARSEVDDRVTGLDSGADDYLVKPFELKELLARIRALLRRPHEVRPAVLKIADLELDTLCAGHRHHWHIWRISSGTHLRDLERVVNFSASFVMLCLSLLPLLDRGRLISWNESPTQLMSVMPNGRLSRLI